MSFAVSVTTGQPWETTADVLVIPMVGIPAIEGEILAELDRRSGGELRDLVEFGEFIPKRLTSALAAPGELPFRRLVVVSTGPRAELDLERVRHVASSAERRLAGRHLATVAVWLGGFGAVIGPNGGEASVVEIADQVVRGLVEGSYDPRLIYRDDVKTSPPVLDRVTIIATGADASAVEAAGERGRIIGEGANIARTLANRASNDLTPLILAEEARAIAERHGLFIDVIGPERATEMGMGMFMAVGRGSDNPPQMIVMRSGAEGQKDALGRHLAIVGKGVCFDSGGISIKPAERMEEMKMDKSGASAVIAAMATVARLSPGTPLLGIAPAVENMPGSHSTRPGDIVTALNGKKVDIINTDAEGRLILGDALTYAERLGATHLVDVATLTGLVGRALGTMMAGAFGTPQPWVDDVLAAGRRAGERYTQLPLVEDYRQEMFGWYAHVTNSGSVDGSLVKSALFLREFVTRPWAHLDIAATAYYTTLLPFAARGATGASHATLVELALAGAQPA